MACLFCPLSKWRGNGNHQTRHTHTHISTHPHPSIQYFFLNVIDGLRLSESKKIKIKSQPYSQRNCIWSNWFSTLGFMNKTTKKNWGEEKANYVLKINLNNFSFPDHTWWWMVGSRMEWIGLINKWFFWRNFPTIFRRIFLGIDVCVLDLRGCELFAYLIIIDLVSIYNH